MYIYMYHGHKLALSQYTLAPAVRACGVVPGRLVQLTVDTDPVRGYIIYELHVHPPSGILYLHYSPSILLHPPTTGPGGIYIPAGSVG
jgi:hypothetical protein